MKTFRPARRRIEVSMGESVRIFRQLQALERAKILARTLKCHPAVLVFPGWDVA